MTRFSSGTAEQRAARPRNSLKTEIPLIVWLVLVWGAMWQDFSLGNLLFGLILAVVIAKIFYLPPVTLSGRFNVLWAVWFFVRFMIWVAQGSLEVFWLAVRPKKPPKSSVFSARLRIADDLLLVIVGEVVSLIPGSLVVEIDRRNATIYFHALDITDAADAESFRARVREVEELVIRTMGDRQVLDVLKAGKLDEYAAQFPNGVVVRGQELENVAAAVVVAEAGEGK